MFVRYNLDHRFDSFEQFYEIYSRHNEQLWAKYSAGQIEKKDVSVGRFFLPLREKGSGYSQNQDLNLAVELSEYYLQNTAKRTQLMPYALEILEYLKTKGFHLHVVTNGFREVQHLKIDRSGLGKYVEERFISDDIGAMKPSPEFFRFALRKLNSDATDCALVGDNLEADILGAMNVGIRAILYNSRGLKDIPETVETINSLLELKQIF